MSPREHPAAASGLLTGLFEADPGSAALVEVLRTRTSIHYETGRDDVPVLCVCLPPAVRLPGSVVTTTLPPPGPLAVRRAGLAQGETRWRVGRWWTPPRPRGLAAPVRLPAAGSWGALPRVRGIVPRALIGHGAGLTPLGDDVLAGALVAAGAIEDPRLPRWQRETREALHPGATTAVSRALLHHALAGWATPELADFVEAVCAGPAEPAAGTAAAALLAVGHSSGSGLLAGVLHVLGTSVTEAAA